MFVASYFCMFVASCVCLLLVLLVSQRTNTLFSTPTAHTLLSDVTQQQHKHASAPPPQKTLVLCKL